MESGATSQSGSLSASVSSLEQMSKDSVKVIYFAETLVRRQGLNPSPSIWIGTSRGNVISVNLNSNALRTQHPTNPIVPLGSVFRVGGEVILIAFLDNTGEQVLPPWEKWEDGNRQQSLTESNAPGWARPRDTGAAARRLGLKSSKDAINRPSGASVPRTSSSSTSSSSGPQGSGHIPHQASLGGTSDTAAADTDRQLLVICSEKQARVVSLPSQTCLYKAKITETSQVVRAAVQHLRPGSLGDTVSGPTTFLACYLANGHFVAYSLPTLRMLMDVDYLPLTDSVSNSFAFGQHGQAVYMGSASELIKVTWSADLSNNLKDVQGELFVPCNMPEPPKRGFLMNLLSGTTSSLDRDELFSGAASGKPVPGATALLPNVRMEKVTAQSSSATSEIAKARNAVLERGERLQRLDTHAQEMADQAKGFGRTAALLASKYEKKNKRWN